MNGPVESISDVVAAKILRVLSFCAHSDTVKGILFALSYKTQSYIWSLELSTVVLYPTAIVKL